jgi:hypothetical protein
VLLGYVVLQKYESDRFLILSQYPIRIRNCKTSLGMLRGRAGDRCECEFDEYRIVGDEQRGLDRGWS